MKTKHFINLTNGIQAIEDYDLSDYEFIRIQSTACEQKRWDFILSDLDYTLLMSLAIGDKCYIYDYGCKKDNPRALWQGVSWIHFALNKCWLDSDSVELSRGGVNMLEYFRWCYHRLSDKTLSKIKYFRKFLSTEDISIIPIPGRTKYDGDYKYYNQLLLKNKEHFMAVCFVCGKGIKMENKLMSVDMGT